jgi:hypothetical protein
MKERPDAIVDSKATPIAGSPARLVGENPLAAGAPEGVLLQV